MTALWSATTQNGFISKWLLPHEIVFVCAFKTKLLFDYTFDVFYILQINLPMVIQSGCAPYLFIQFFFLSPYLLLLVNSNWRFINAFKVHITLVLFFFFLLPTIFASLTLWLLRVGTCMVCAFCCCVRSRTDCSVR